ncbi:2-aminoethylphosphonate--pyruvate transaminase [Kosakonia quasisacchari]|uniref:2-aminoethylphosphonate--pyruvate transaminase n=1 Tax=Kosakonia quasisacchari TaxID=2529380 RepID=A0A4R0HFV8_9ENTR|nr:2-aminoethylphosphonate--pyruvate transaminase [Kosakonia quasisacchari]TCC09263.1 2-aminoethylphosphonate--pyruvate transaminase [Kosakonia quasisacchari]
MKKIILAPGPLTTNPLVRDSASVDYPARDSSVTLMTSRIRARLLELSSGNDTHTTILLQGCGTFAVEAAIQTLIPRETGHALVLANGVYAQRIYEICKRLALKTSLHTTSDLIPVNPLDVRQILEADTSITDVLFVHCETATGIINPLHQVADVVSSMGRGFIVDAMSSFGALPVDLKATPIRALITSSNKCLEGLPGIGIIIADRQHLNKCQANARSLSLDLYEQYQRFEADGQWRFTPPVQIVAALDHAISLLIAEGGIDSRYQRYQENMQELISHMQMLDFIPVLSPEVQSPIIAAFYYPTNFNFAELYERLKADNIFLYPGALTERQTFRIGCIGAINRHDISFVINKIAAICKPAFDYKIATSSDYADK